MELMKVERTDQIIAAEINIIRHRTKKILLQSAIEIGERLKEAKTKVQYGEWENWLKNNVDYSVRNAQNLMRIATEYKNEKSLEINENSNTNTSSYLGISQAIELLALPESERETFIENNDVEDMTTKELKGAIKREKDAIKAKEELQKQLDEMSGKLLTINNEKKRLSHELDKEKNKPPMEDEDLKQQLEIKEQETKNFEATIEKLKGTLEATNKELEEVKENQITEVVGMSEGEKKKQQEKLDELEKKAREVTEQLEKSEAARKQLEEENKVNQDKMTTIEVTSKLVIHFNAVKDAFDKLIAEVNCLKEVDMDEYERYKGIPNKLIDKLELAAKEA